MAFDTAQEIVAGLRRHFLSSDNYDEVGCYGEIFTSELTLPDTRRRADAVYMNLMESRGMTIDIVEIKVSRSDFLSELSNPSKAEDFFRYSSRFWIAAPNEQVAPPEMIPPGWGLLLPPKRKNGKSWQVAVEPSVRVPNLDMRFLGMITNRLRDLSMRSWNEREATHRIEINKAESYGRKEAANDSELTEEHVRSLELIEKLESSLGKTLSGWVGSTEGHVTVRELVAAYELLGRGPQIAKNRLQSSIRSARQARDVASEMVERLDAAAKEIGMDVSSY